ncbi:hypothetical protein TWF281_001344 [Arthrobotrys megalospora]
MIDTTDLQEWLLSLRDSAVDLNTLSRFCYQARHSEMVKAVTLRAEASGEGRDTSSLTAQYARIRHLIGRLGSYIKAAGILVDAARHYPQLFTDYSIETATSDPNFTPPAYRSQSSINGIINRMVKDPSLCRSYQDELHAQDERFHLELEERIKKVYKTSNFKLKTHAEIILLDLFYRKGFQFLDHNRYIGVSKLSCFLCYRYFQAHPLGAQTSGCSNNLYLQWQPPYVRENVPSLVKAQEDILNTMIQGIRKFVLDTVVPGYQGLKPHPASTTGISTSHGTITPYPTHTEIKSEGPTLRESYANTPTHEPTPTNVAAIPSELAEQSDGGVPLFLYSEDSDNGGVPLF